MSFHAAHFIGEMKAESVYSVGALSSKLAWYGTQLANRFDQFHAIRYV